MDYLLIFLTVAAGGVLVFTALFIYIYCLLAVFEWFLELL